MSERKLYLVKVMHLGGGHLIVRSDSPEGAASFMRIVLLDEGLVSSDVKHKYLVSEEADDLGDGIWLPGYDTSDDLEDVLRQKPLPWDPERQRLWKDPVEMEL